MVMRRVTTDQETGCWIYTPPFSSRGRPRVTVNGQNMAAYEYTWLAHTRQIVPEGMMLLHSCDRGDEGCVNQKHLRIGTPSENNKDAVQRGRHKNQHTGKSRCIRGHDLNDPTIGRPRKDGSRACRVCERMRRAGLT